MSYLYMKAGFDYQIDARDELQELGVVPSLPSQTIFGDTLTGKDQGKQVRLLSFFDPQKEDALAVSGKYLSEIFSQFDEVDWFRMELMVPETSKKALERYLAAHQMEDPTQVFFYATDQSMDQVQKQLHMAPEMQGRINMVALADTSGMIRQYYDLTEGKQFVRLVEHIAMLRPQEEEERQEALFRREREL